MRMFLILIMLLIVSLVGSALAMTIDVPGDQPTIQAGIDAALAGDTVRVACGIYYEHDIAMKSGVWLRGDPEDPACVTIDAQRLGRAIQCSNVDAAAGIEGFTITGGYVTGGSMPRGGAISLLFSSPAIRSCRFIANEAESGGGGIYVYRSLPVIEDCVFTGNSSIDGGAIYINHADPVVRDCTFHGNQCMFWGGAIFVANYAAPTIIGCTLADNRAYSGGGFWCVNECRTIFENSVIAFSSRGGGLVAEHNSGHESTVTISCSDVFGNVGGDYGGTLTDQTGIDGNISSDPLFCDLAGGDLSLTVGSPCLPDWNDCDVLMGANGAGCPVAGVADGAAGFDAGRSITARPNPFHGGTEVGFRLETTTAVAIRVFDPAGRMVREIATDRVYAPGQHAVVWDGRDDAGRRVESGTYFVRLRLGDRTSTGSVVAVR